MSRYQLLPLSQASEPAQFDVKPSITVISPNEFLLLSWTGISTLGLFVTDEGEPVRGTLEWSSHPEAICLLISCSSFDVLWPGFKALTIRTSHPYSRTIPLKCMISKVKPSYSLLASHHHRNRCLQLEIPHTSVRHHHRPWEVGSGVSTRWDERISYQVLEDIWFPQLKNWRKCGEFLSSCLGRNIWSSMWFLYVDKAAVNFDSHISCRSFMPVRVTKSSRTLFMRFNCMQYTLHKAPSENLTSLPCFADSFSACFLDQFRQLDSDQHSSCIQFYLASSISPGGQALAWHFSEQHSFQLWYFHAMAVWISLIVD